MSIRERIGAELKALRLEQKLTTRALAERAGLGYGHIARIESGRYDTRLDTINQIVEALGATIVIQK